MSQLIDRISKFFGIYDGPPAVKAFWDRIPPPRAARIREIRQAIESRGFWEEQVEWRIMTTTTSRIDPVEYDGNKVVPRPRRVRPRVHLPLPHGRACG